MKYFQFTGNLHNPFEDMQKIKVYELDALSVASVDADESELGIFYRSQVIELSEISSEEFDGFKKQSVLYELEQNGLKAHRDELLSESVITFKEKEFDSDDKALCRMSLFIQNAKNKALLENKEFDLDNEKVSFRAKNGEFVELSIKELMQMLTLGLEQMNALVNTYK